MEAAYSAFNFTVWGCFAGFVAATAAVVWLHRKRYPDYPCVSFPPPEEKQ